VALRSIGWSEWLRGMVRGGGPWWVRWPARLMLLGAVVSAGFLPYDHEVGGECRVTPGAQRGIRSQLDDEILQIHVRHGDRVEAGTLIATLALRDERAALEVAKAELAAAQADLDMMRNGPRAEEIAVAQEGVEIARSALAYYEKRFQRMSDLYKTKSIPEDDYEASQKDYLEAKGELNSEQKELEKLQVGYREENVRAAEATVEKCRAEVAHHQEKVALGKIVSPVAGTIVTVNVTDRVGQAVEKGDLIAVVQDTSQNYVEVFGQQPAIENVRPGMPVHLRFWAMEGRDVTGLVREISRTTEEADGMTVERIRSDREEQYRRAAAPNADQRLRLSVDFDSTSQTTTPGMTGYARITIEPGLFWEALARPLYRFIGVEVWSWLP
jgi:putative peptide zinc metalloprotease protein